MCYLRCMEYTYCSVCPRLCHVRSKLRRGTDRFCSGRYKFTAHLCYITRQRMAADEQACREANEREEREEEAEAEAARNGRGRGRRRRRRRARERRVPEVRMGSNEDGRCDACEAAATRRDGAVVVQDYQGGGGTMGGGWIMGLGGLELEYGGGGGGRVERGVVRVAMG